jgi:hypothetical protein
MAALTNIGPQTGTIAMNEEETVEGENHLIDQRLNVTGIFNKMEALSPSSKMLSSRMRPYIVFKKKF